MRIGIHTAGLVSVLGFGLYCLSSSIDGNYPQAWAAGVGTGFAALMWAFAVKLSDEDERVAPKPVVVEPDPVTRELYRQLAEAIEKKKARRQIRQAIRERKHQLLAGGRA